MQYFLNASFGSFFTILLIFSNLFLEVINVNKSKLIVNVIFNDKLIMSEDYNIFKEKIEKKLWMKKKSLNFVFLIP